MERGREGKLDGWCVDWLTGFTYWVIGCCKDSLKVINLYDLLRKKKCVDCVVSALKSFVWISESIKIFLGIYSNKRKDWCMMMMMTLSSKMLIVMYRRNNNMFFGIINNRLFAWDLFLDASNAETLLFLFIFIRKINLTPLLW